MVKHTSARHGLRIGPGARLLPDRDEQQAVLVEIAALHVSGLALCAITRARRTRASWRGTDGRSPRPRSVGLFPTVRLVAAEQRPGNAGRMMSRVTAEAARRLA